MEIRKLLIAIETSQLQLKALPRQPGNRGAMCGGNKKFSASRYLGRIETASGS